MNTKSLLLILALSLLLIATASVRLSSRVDTPPSVVTHDSDDALEVTVSLKVRFRLPIFKKESI
ncbi:MAG: hypothetical protein AAF465_05875 [Pseudomonadota bacterium]